MKLESIFRQLLEDRKESFRDVISHLLSKPNTGRVSLILGDERLVKAYDSVFNYTTRGTNKNTYSVDIQRWESNSGDRYLVIDDGDIICAAFVNNDNTLVGIITERGFENVGIGSNLIKFIQKNVSNLKFDSHRSLQGDNLIKKFESANLIKQKKEQQNEI